MICYPLLATANGKKTTIRTQRELLSHFDNVFDPDLHCTIFGASEKDVWGNGQGFTIGDGIIWFDGIMPRGEKPDTHAPDYWTQYRFKIITVNNGGKPHCEQQR
jgi:hypothetical protein